ncbi:hypothetical protein [Spirosoma fluviale]|uniref:Toprim domain-containing protein n=1 Tax=Spirosoma fluviale TaxID=1597977 RepID=A0A286G266_9BACT|nr:hypothetical protein [Spirosoma fluviale]SOD89074.1 hypothetical protein SAMN06269250_2941 [Spirosoma fluviale]
MDSIVFHIDADKAGQDLVDSIKAYFGNRRVQIIVKAEEVVADKVAQDEVTEPDYALPYDDIVRIANALDRNEPVDVMAEVKKFMETQ